MDNKIVKLIKNKDEKGLDLLINSYIDNIHYISSSIIGSYGKKEDIQECVSDILLDIWNNINQFEDSRGTFKTFILIKSKYKALDYKRKLVKKNERLKEEHIEDINNLKIDNSFECTNEVLDEVIEIIKKFKEPDKTYFYLRYFRDYDLSSIAKMFDDTKSGVENRLYRSRLKIKNILGRG
ncbi:MAG: sigma-70 family RNA polymerase sigma factor [Peptostreptococcaceae bacterium]